MIVFLWVALSKLVSLVKIGDSVIERSIELIVSLIIIIEVELSRHIGPSLACTILSLRLFHGFIGDASEVTPLVVADHAVSIMVASTQDRLNIVLLGVVVVGAQVIDKARRGYGVMTFRDLVKQLQFSIVGESLELALGLASLSVQLHFLVEEALEEVNHLFLDRG